MQTAQKIQTLNIDPALNLFLEEWDRQYDFKASRIPLFDTVQTAQWTLEQQRHFVRILYHQRAHFDDVLWYMANFAPDAESKEMILENMRDEFGRNGRSHEKLYLDFAKSLGVNLVYELIEEKFYLPFLRDYNSGHLRWLREHEWDCRLAAFAALERLDNIDYTNLKKIVESFGSQKIDMVFFNVHIYVQHYESVENCRFKELWDVQPELVKNAFNFIGEYQLKIWEQISNTVFNYTEEKSAA